MATQQRPTVDASYWMVTAPGADRPPPESDLTADVAVIGGGIAGLCTAWELVSAGLDVVVLEADRIAAGVSGHTTAKVTAAHGLKYARLEAEHGSETAYLYGQSQQEAVDRIVALCAELGIEADLERAPALTYLRDPEGVHDLKAEAAAARRAGLDASYVTETELPFEVAGAVRVDGQLQFHPRKFLLGLAERIEAAGGRIHERSRVTALHDATRCRLTVEHPGDGGEVTGDSGGGDLGETGSGGGETGGRGVTVTARDVVIATHYPVFDRTLLLTLLEPRRELVLAAPVPTEAAPVGMFITPEDRTRSLRSAPYDSGRRLLVVTGEAFEPGAGDVRDRFERLDAWARTSLPGFAEADSVYRWAAQDNDSVDQLPYVGHAHPGSQHVYVATGFGGWGMSNGVMAGRLLAAHIVGGPRPAWTELYDPRRLPPVRDAGHAAAQQASVAGHFVGDRLHTGEAASLADVPRGGGAVVRLGGKPCAVHRDDTGEVTAVSARCTHLGCLVHYNDAEQTWECPCHGSRFGTDGSVLQGPATRPLRQRELPDLADPAE
ncbi:FAD-dependent oxidoreductase [Streptomyces cavernicola]|uniref:FAD-dependent oxidoreductase n=1 Tax=Streptomyces cavernicola TaxID=3043613 RepID=A0ABT6S9K3_9ACTN|nr:FAD-dependent oxidoreductase [Streptomyces sp. B-S-A6]MDI3404138.1 FAD-dependent oxidoreductase [Streptomyces sp. B-S-A6]